MTFPKHKNPAKGNEATAPYNFVPLPDKIETLPLDDLPPHNRYDTTRHTGRIEVKLTTSSPLYIRGGLSPELFAKIGKEPFNKLSHDEKQQVAQFFHTHTNPVIPGSSLRGMLRSMIEIVTYGKVQPVSDKPTMFFRAVAASNSDPLKQPYQDALGKYGTKVHAGYLVKKGDDWFVKPALLPNDIELDVGDKYLKVKERIIDRQMIAGFKKFDDPEYIPQIHQVRFSVEKRTDKRGRSYASVNNIGAEDADYPQQGTLVCSGNMLETDSSGKKSRRKNHVLVLVRNENSPLIKINTQAINDYLAGLTEFQKQSPPFDEKFGCLIDGNPVFYVEEDGEIYSFGHTPNFRVPMYPKEKGQATKPLDFVPDTLWRITDIDFAEAMFGYVKEVETKKPKEKAYAGRIFVGDARLDQDTNSIWLNNSPITPKILGGPKPTSFQLYLTQEYPNDKKRLLHYGTSLRRTVIRGHKLYWHRGENPAIENDNPNAGSTQLTQITPLKPGISFTFTIHFENLSDLELGALWWVLKLGANPNYRLKLGMGKPLGMGAVKTEPTLYLTHRKTRYQSMFNGKQWQKGVTSDNDNEQVDKFADVFENFIKETHKDAFGGDGRLAQLFALLNFPGPQPSKTKYMELQDFKAREVLPTPRGV